MMMKKARIMEGLWLLVVALMVPQAGNAKQPEIMVDTMISFENQYDQPRIVTICEAKYRCEPVAFSQQAFVGTWVNDDANTGGMTRLIIGMEGNTLTVHGYGKCHPSDCDWGKITASYTGNPFRAVYKQGFKTDTLTIKLVSKNALHVHSTNIFHDGTNRDYEADDYMHRKPSVAFRMPTLVSPANGTVFNKFPRKTKLVWMPVPTAKSYTVEIDCYHCCRANKWCTDVGKTHHLKRNLRTTSYTFRFVGAQPGRWRVWAVSADGRESEKTPWWEFEYTR